MNQYHRFLSLAKDKLKVKDKEAEQYLLSALQDDPKGHEALFLLGKFYHENSKFDRAIVAYKKALSVKPNLTDAAISLSVLYNDLGRYEEGRLVFNRAKQQIDSVDRVEDSYVNENLSNKHIEMGDMYESYSRYEEALQEYEKALKLTPDQPKIIVKVAKLYEKQGTLSQCAKTLKSLKSANPNYVPGLVQLGLTYYSQGKMIEALREWERVLDVDPKNSDALMYIDMANKASTTFV